MAVLARSTFAFMMFIGAVCATSPASAAGRAALVIGNAAYENAPSLANPANDAGDIAAALEGLGFEVTRIADAGYDAMRTALRDFSAESSGADVAIVFFAGHGIEIDGRNYLVPVDATLASDRDALFEAVPLDLVIDAVSGAAGLKLVILDACRDNPFRARMARAGATRSIGRGLTRIEPDAGTLVAYAAKEGTTAADGEGANSPFTTALLAHLAEPGLEVSFLFRKVRDSVLAATANTQEPFTYGSLPGRAFYLNQAEAPHDDGPVAASPAGPDNSSLELAYWEAVRHSDDPALIEGYLDRFPDGVFVDLARALITALQPHAPPPRAQVLPPPPADVILQVQRELARIGCEPGTPDGEWGPRSRQALARYIEAAGGMAPPAGPDAELLGRLESESATVCTRRAAVAPPSPPPAPPDGNDQPATRSFSNPTVSGLPVDICLSPFKGCEGAAARAFCESHGYRTAQHTAYRVFPTTAHMTGGTCQPHGLVVCGGYTEIVCAR